MIAHWLASAADGAILRILGDPASTRDYVYIDDVVAALVRVHHYRGALPDTLNVGSGRPTTLAELADIVLAAVADPTVSVQVGPGRPFDVDRTWLDTSLARRMLEWVPEVPLTEGVRRSWCSLRATRTPS